MPYKKIPLLRNIVQWWRYKQVTKATASLLEITGWNIFSPITHSHPIPKFIPDRLNTHTFWLNLDFDWIEVCDELWVYMQPGWDQSYGVARELKFAQRRDKPIRYVNMDYTFEGEAPRFYVLPKEVRE